jgi:hypothetical protein
VDVLRLPAWRLPRLDVEKLSDDQLVEGFQRAVYYLDPTCLAHFGEALLARPSTREKLDPREVYEVLIRFLRDPARAAELAVKAQAYAKSQNESPARFMLMELQNRVMMGDGRSAQRLIEILSTQYRKEPGIAQALMQILVQLGVVTPDGQVRTPPSQAEAAPPAPAGGLWTPGDPVAKPASESKSGLWLPD